MDKVKLRSEEVIFQKEMQGFRIVAKKSAHSGAGELKATSGKKIAFSDAMKHYENPYRYLRQLINKSEIADSEVYRFFVKIGYEILNKDGFQVSGGERSEYRLLQEISDAQNYDLLLIDEPESSFDNMFLNSNVNALIRDIARTMPIIVVTHNNTVGASIGADYVLCAQKQATRAGVVYKIFSGYPTDKSLCCADGSTLPSHQIMMDSLEAGKDAYEARRRGYETVEN
jgi:ABC-type glutathione transport system ATPase component